MRKITLIVLAFVFSAFVWNCGGGIGRYSSNGDNNNNTNGNGTDLWTAPQNVHVVPLTRATLSWTQPDGDVDHYEVSVDGGGMSQIDPPACASGTCEHTVPGLRTSEVHAVGVRYVRDGTPSETAPVEVDTHWKERAYTGPVSGQQLGFASSVGDVNGDGAPEILFRSVAQWTYLFYGGMNHFLDQDGALMPRASFHGDDEAFANQALIADVTCDGYADVLIADYHSDADGLGRVFIFKGAPLDLGTAILGTFADPLMESTFIVTADAASLDEADLGLSMAAGRLNEDACSELLMGAPRWVNVWADPDYNKGKLFFLPGGISADRTMFAGSDLDIEQGAAQYDELGRVAWRVGDIDGDGLDELLYSSVQGINSLTFRLFEYDPATSAYGSRAFRSLDGGILHAFAGSLGDIDGDGFGDFFIRLRDVVAETTTLYIFKGGSPLSTFPEHQLVRVSVDDDGFGLGVAAGDIDVDGQVEIVVGENIKTSVYDYDGIDIETVPDDIPVPGIGLQIIDFNGDSYLDLIAGDPRNLVISNPFIDGLAGGVWLYF